VVITLVEISKQKLALEELQRKEHDLKESQRIAHVGSWRLDVATNEVIWTEELYRMYGFDPSLPVPPYTEHMKLFTPESWEKLSAALAHTRETGVPYTLELETVRKDGTNGWMWVQGEAEVDSAGKTVELLGAAQDITERKQTEEVLVKLRRAVEQSVSTIVITDVDGNIEYANPQFEKTTGYTIEEALGQNPRMLKTGHTKPQEYQELWESILAGKEWRGQFHNQRKDGSTYWEYATISPIRDTSGKITHFLAVKEDITERIDHETKLKRMQTQQRRQFELLDAAEKIAHMGSWSWDLETDSMTWSNNLYRLLQRDPKQGTPNFFIDGTLFTSESLEQLQRALQDAREKGTSHELHLSAVRSDGTTLPCLAGVKAQVNGAGTVSELYGSLQEIQP
ncbi:MAG: PAS domain S-box protein, partial [Pelovirga sp.]